MVEIGRDMSMALHEANNLFTTDVKLLEKFAIASIKTILSVYLRVECLKEACLL